MGICIFSISIHVVIFNGFSFQFLMGKGYGLLGRSLNLEMKNLEYGLMGYDMKSLEGSWVGNLIEKKKATL